MDFGEELVVRGGDGEIALDQELGFALSEVEAVALLGEDRGDVGLRERVSSARSEKGREDALR